MEPEIKSDGTLIYPAANGVTYVFTATNFKIHVARHPELKDPYVQRLIGAACSDPDCYTKGPDGGQVSYYIIDSERYVNGTLIVTYVKVVTYPARHKKTRIIATAWRNTSPTNYVIHYLEEILWKKKNSPI